MSERDASGLLLLFRNDIGIEDRLDHFSAATEIVRGGIRQTLDRRNVSRIQKMFDLKLVLNAHGDYIDAAQTVGELDAPFITFVEGANAPDHVYNPMFKRSIDNSFDSHFNGRPFTDATVYGQDPYNWQEARDRGLLKKGSIIAPVDIRNYGARLLDALMGGDYSQEYLNARIGLEGLLQEDPHSLLETSRNRGLLIMRSNELREHVAIEQVATTLTSIADVVEGKESHFDTDTAVKVRAIYDKQRREVDGPLEVGIVYGSAHHKIRHTFEGFKLPVSRIFAAPRIGSFCFVGSNLDTFFGGYVTKPNEQVIEKWARAFVLESVFSAILNYPHVFEAVHVDRQVSSYNWRLAQRLARQYSHDQHMYLDVIARLRQDPRLLRDDFIAHGAKLRTT